MGRAIGTDTLAHRNALETQINTTPALRQILRRATQQALVSTPADSRSCAHEHWLARCFQVEASDEAPLAPYALLAEGKEPGETLWAHVQPVHFQLARTHLVLHGSNGLDLTAEEASILLEEAQKVAALHNLTLIAPTPLSWYISGDALGPVTGSSPYLAEGQNIELWLPSSRKGVRGHARTWMQFQNEVQMVWATHDINLQREAQGQLPVNAIWLWGQGRLHTPPACAVSAVFSNKSVTQGLGLAAGLPFASTPATFAEFHALPALNSSHAALVELDNFIRPAIQHNASAWHAVLMQLEHDWFAPALAALQEGILPALMLTLTGETSSITLRLTRTDLYKIWRWRSLPRFIGWR